MLTFKQLQAIADRIYNDSAKENKPQHLCAVSLEWGKGKSWYFDDNNGTCEWYETKEQLQGAICMYLKINFPQYV